MLDLLEKVTSIRSGDDMDAGRNCYALSEEEDTAIDLVDGRVRFSQVNSSFARTEFA